MRCLRSSVFVLTVCIAGAALSPVPAHAADPAVDPTATGYVVYLGLTLSLENQREDYPVVWAESDHVELRKDGQNVRVARDGAAVKSGVVPRIGRAGLTIANLRGQRVYSYTNHPDRAALGEQLALMSAQADVQQAAEMRRYAAAEQLNRLGGPTGNPGAGDPTRQKAQVELQEATRNLENVYASPEYGGVLDGTYPVNTDDNGAGGTFDAFELTFEISAPDTRTDTYAVLRLFIRDPGKPELNTPVLHFFRLPRLGPQPRRVTVMRDRLPRGYAVESFSVHVFADGEELPTSVSRNRMEVNAAEAQQFLILQHQQAHGKGSAPIAIIPVLLPSELRHLIPADQAAATIDVEVDREGHVTKLTLSRGVAGTLSPELSAALQRVRFLPALLNGKAVAGVGTFALAEFTP